MKLKGQTVARALFQGFRKPIDKLFHMRVANSRIGTQPKAYVFSLRVNEEVSQMRMA
jgi:hypothetical protein